MVVNGPIYKSGFKSVIRNKVKKKGDYPEQVLYWSRKTDIEMYYLNFR